MSGHLTENVRVRIDQELRRELERQAATLERKPAELARMLIREGLERRKAETARRGRAR